MKYRFFISIAFAVLAVCSCTKSSNGDTPNPDPDPDPILFPTEQQQKIEDTSNALIEEIKANEFGDIVDLIEYFVETYCDEDVDLSELEDKYEAIVEDALTTNREEGYNDKRKRDYYIYEFEKFIFNIYDYKGTIIAGKKKWTCKSSNKFSLEFKDQFGKTCTLELKPSGKVGTFLISSFSEYHRFYDYDVNCDGVVDYDCFTETYESEFYANVPEKLQVSLFQGSDQVFGAEYTLETNLENVQENLPEDIEDLRVDFTASVDCAGYSATIERLYYNGKKVEVNVSLTHNGKTLISESLSVHDFTIDTDDDIPFRGGKCEFDINVMDGVQVAIEVSNAYKFCDIVDSGDDDSPEDFAADINRYFEAKVYFDNTNTVQATIEFRCFSEGKSYFVAPAMVFEDGSSYSVEDFLGEDFLDEFADKIERMVENFERLVD